MEKTDISVFHCLEMSASNTIAFAPFSSIIISRAVCELQFLLWLIMANIHYYSSCQHSINVAKKDLCMILWFAGCKCTEETVQFFHAIKKILVVAQWLMHAKTHKPVFKTSKNHLKNFGKSQQVLATRNQINWATCSRRLHLAWLKLSTSLIAKFPTKERPVWL